MSQRQAPPPATLTTASPSASRLQSVLSWPARFPGVVSIRRLDSEQHRGAPSRRGGAGAISGYTSLPPSSGGQSPRASPESRGAPQKRKAGGENHFGRAGE